MVRLGRFLLGMALVALLASLAGRVHPIGDSLAVFRPWIGAGALVATLLARPGWRAALGVVALVGLALWPVGRMVLAPNVAPEGALVLYQKNLSFRLPEAEPVVDDILATRAGLVTLQEVTERTGAVLEGLSETHPTQVVCPFAAVGAVAIASKYQQVPGQSRCVPGEGMAALQLMTPMGKVWVVSLHLHWPFPYQQAAQVQRLAPHLDGLEGPVILAGDFNMVPWADAVQGIARRTGTTRAGHVRPTFDFMEGWVPIPIDHVLAGPGGEVTRRPFLGSDHRGLLAKVRPGG